MFKFFAEKFENLKNALKHTTNSLSGIDSVESEEEFSEFVLEEMEDTLISADLGVSYAAELIDKLRGQNKINPAQVNEF